MPARPRPSSRPRPRDYGELEAAAARLLGTPPADPAPRRQRALRIDVSEAASGQMALDMVERAVRDQHPFALALIDMRMPGWDGLTTAQAIRQVDETIEIVFVTAHSEHAIQEVVERAGPHVGYLCKPFVAEEIQQIATKAIHDWSRLRSLESLLGTLSELRADHGQRALLLRHIFERATRWLGAGDAMLIALDQPGMPPPDRGSAADSDSRDGASSTNASIGASTSASIVAATGVLARPDRAQTCLDALRPLLGSETICATGAATYFPFERCALIVHSNSGARLSTERRYLFRLFLEHCGQALENARLHQALLAREKLSAVGQALSMVVHDLRSPIGIIVNSAELAKEEHGVPPHVDALLDMIVSATDSAMAIVNDVLDFTRDLRLDKSSCRVDALLEPLRAHLAERLAETRVRLALDAPPQRHLMCDPRKMHRALINLVNNAIDALAAARTPDPVVTVNAAAAGDIMLFRVVDNGPGIPGSIRDRVLEPFVTADKPTGTGLGLAIVRQIAEAHGGGVEVETSSRGTSFTLRIPAGQV